MPEVRRASARPRGGAGTARDRAVLVAVRALSRALDILGTDPGKSSSQDRLGRGGLSPAPGAAGPASARYKDAKDGIPGSASPDARPTSSRKRRERRARAHARALARGGPGSTGGCGGTDPDAPVGSAVRDGQPPRPAGTASLVKATARAVAWAVAGTLQRAQAPRSARDQRRAAHWQQHQQGPRGGGGPGSKPPSGTTPAAAAGLRGQAAAHPGPAEEAPARDPTTQPCPPSPPDVPPVNLPPFRTSTASPT